MKKKKKTAKKEERYELESAPLPYMHSRSVTSTQFKVYTWLSYAEPMLFTLSFVLIKYFYSRNRQHKADALGAKPMHINSYILYHSTIGQLELNGKQQNIFSFNQIIIISHL